MNPIIETTPPITKRFGRKIALQDVQLNLEPDKALGLIGPNGAGKTTLLRIMAGIHPPTTGCMRIMGRNSTSLRPEERQKIGYVSENQELPGWMTLKELINYLKPLYPTWDDDFCSRLQNLFELPQDQKIKTFSRGMKMKAAFLSSLAYRPKLLLLDEPFSGLDPVVLSDLLDALVEVTQQAEWTMILSSHDMDHVERLVDEVAILKSPHILLRESIESLQTRFRRIDFLTDAAEPAVAVLPTTWSRYRHQGRRVCLIDSAWSDASTSGVRQHFPDAREIEINSMSLKEIYVALLRPQPSPTAATAVA